MHHRLCGRAVAVLWITFSTVAAFAAELSEDRFIDWNYYNNAGWRAANRGDLAEAARRFVLAVDVLRPEWERSPRLMARSYADLAWVMYKQGRTQEAEPLARWALEVRAVRCGPESEPTAQSLYELALILDDRSQFAEAEALLRRSIAAWEKHLGPYDVRVTFYLTELARVLTSQRKLDQAESVYRRILGQPERALPARHPYRITSLIGLGRIYTAKGEPIRARFQDAQVLPLLETLPPSDYPDVALPLIQYIGQLKQAGRIAEATQLEDGARALLVQIDKGQNDQLKALKRVVRAAQGESGVAAPNDPARSTLIGAKPAPDPVVRGSR